MLKHKKAQALIEYSLVFAAVIAAVVIMDNYFKRSINAKLKRTALGLNAVFNEINR